MRLSVVATSQRHHTKQYSLQSFSVRKEGLINSPPPLRYYVFDIYMAISCAFQSTSALPYGGFKFFKFFFLSLYKNKKEQTRTNKKYLMEVCLGTSSTVFL